MLTVFGLIVFALIFGGMLRANARRWRYLAAAYAGEPGPALDQRSMRSVVLIGMGAFNSLKGIVTIGVHANGVSLRVMPVFSLFHTPLFIPYSDIQGWQTTWYLDSNSNELQFRRATEVKLVLPEDDTKWIKSHAGSKMMLRDAAPPRGNVGRGWRTLLVAHALVSLAILGWFSAYMLLQ